MKMLIACLIGGAAIGFGFEKALQPTIESSITATDWQRLAIAGGAAFLGALFGWLAKGVCGSGKKS